MSTFKIAFAGTHGTGKTTATYQLAAELQKGGVNTSIIYEIARRPEFVSRINTSSTPEDQRNIILTQMKMESVMQREKYDVLLCDRAILDNYAYYLAAVERSDKPDPYPWLAEAIKSESATYEMLIIVKPDQPITDDGVRSTDTNFQLQIHERVMDLVKGIKPRVLCVVDASELRRDAFIAELVKDIIKKI